jgi:hypothetical protein
MHIMKIKKSALNFASCIAISSLPLAALADLQSLDEASMSNVTGQAGVTIELETEIDIGAIIYTDEGSLSVNEVFIGGTNRVDLFQEGMDAANGGNPFIINATTKLDELKIDFDISADGEAQIKIFPTNFAAPVDFRITTGAWELQDSDGNATLTLLDNFAMDGIFTQMWAKIGQDDTLGEERLNLQVRMGIDDLDFDVPFLGLGIRDMRMTRSDYDDNPNLLSANAYIEANIYNGERAAGGDALAIDLVSMDADITVGAIQLGGTSIGSMKLDNLSIENSTMRIYGH